MSWDKHRWLCIHGEKEDLDWHDCSKCKEICRKLGHNHKEDGYESLQGWHFWSRSYTIRETEGKKSITCLTCFMESFNPGDIDQKYCGKCNVFHK